MLMQAGPPYPPAGAVVGGVPTVSVDVPICAVFIALFLGGAVSHMTLFRRNLARGHKFIPSAATFGFCMARITANALRIAWACHQRNVRLAIAAQVFVAAGVIVLFILNLLYAQRMLRAAHPRVGWSRLCSLVFKALYVLIVISLVMLITVTVQSFYTLNSNTRRIDRDIQLYGSTFFTVFSFLPYPILAYVLLAPRNGRPIEKFGTGSWRAKVIILCVTTFLLCLGASFRTGTSYETPRPANNPAWYHHKACFYIFDFTLEVLVVYIYLLGRVDQRFYVPDGSSKVKHYRCPQAEADKAPEQGSKTSFSNIQAKMKDDRNGDIL